MYEIIFFVTWYVAGILNGISGLGAALLAVPVMLQFIEPQTVIPVSSVLGMVICSEIGLLYFRYCLVKPLIQLILSSVPGLILGVFILLIIPAPVLLFCIGIVMIAYVIWQLSDKKTPSVHSEKKYEIYLAGFSSGFLITSVAFGGPPVAMYALRANWGQKETLATMNTYVLASVPIAMIIFISSGLFTQEVLRLFFIGAVAVTLGLLTSIPFVKYIKLHVFRRILFCVIGFGGITCIVNAFLK